MFIAIEKRESPWSWDGSKPLERILSACCQIDQESRPSIDNVLRELRLLVSKPTTTIIRNNLSDLDPQQVPPEFKKEGRDWWAIFNPSVPRVLDISLSLTLEHERRVDPIAWYHSSGLNLEPHKATFFVCDSLPMGSLLLQDAKVQHRFMMRRPVRERGKSINWT